MSYRIHHRRRARFRIAGVWMLMAFLWLTGLRGVHGQAATPTEYEIKAAMLYRFAQFLEWPTNRPLATDAPLVFGIVGQDPFGGTIDTVLKGQKVGERAIVINRYSQATALTNCHLLFLSRSLGAETEKVLVELHAAPSLTVGEDEEFIRRGGHIRLYLQENKVRFDVNLAALERSGLKMHPQVLKLATRITRDGKDVKK